MPHVLWSLSFWLVGTDTIFGPQISVRSGWSTVLFRSSVYLLLFSVPVFINSYEMSAEVSNRGFFCISFWFCQSFLHAFRNSYWMHTVRTSMLSWWYNPFTTIKYLSLSLAIFLVPKRAIALNYQVKWLTPWLQVSPFPLHLYLRFKSTSQKLLRLASPPSRHDRSQNRD